MIRPARFVFFEEDANLKYRIDSEHVGRESWLIHEGNGPIDVKVFFKPDRPSAPAALLIFDIPPGVSEGVHRHQLSDEDGGWNEFYYIVAGQGRMTINGDVVPVTAGDNIHIPIGVERGIENTSATERLKVYLVSISLAKTDSAAVSNAG